MKRARFAWFATLLVALILASPATPSGVDPDSGVTLHRNGLNPPILRAPAGTAYLDDYGNEDASWKITGTVWIVENPGTAVIGQEGPYLSWGHWIDTAFGEGEWHTCYRAPFDATFKKGLTTIRASWLSGQLCSGSEPGCPGEH